MTYVDDLPVFAKNKEVLKEVIKLLENLYQLENFGLIKKLLGIEIN